MKGLCCLGSYKKYVPLLLRVALLFVLFAHGWDKLVGGVEARTRIGNAMATYGITFFPAFRGFLAAYAESIGVVLIFLGICTRFNAFLLAFTMLTAILMKVTGEPGIERLGELSAAVYILTVCLALMLTGAGQVFNLEKKLCGKEC